MHRRLGGATLSQLAFPGESNPNFPWEKSYRNNTLVKRVIKKSIVSVKTLFLFVVLRWPFVVDRTLDFFLSSCLPFSLAFLRCLFSLSVFLSDFPSFFLKDPLFWVRRRILGSAIHYTLQPQLTNTSLRCVIASINKYVSSLCHNLSLTHLFLFSNTLLNQQ